MSTPLLVTPTSTLMKKTSSILWQKDWYWQGAPKKLGTSICLERVEGNLAASSCSKQSATNKAPPNLQYLFTQKLQWLQCTIPKIHTQPRTGCHGTSSVTRDIWACALLHFADLSSLQATILTDIFGSKATKEKRLLDSYSRHDFLQNVDALYYKWVT